MKRLVSIVLLMLLLSGCASKDSSVDRAMMIRQKLLQSNGCTFDVQITADYSDVIYTFKMHCICDSQGGISFTVLEPETIRNICGKIEKNQGKLTFDDKVLAFELLADGQVTPVSAPWIMIRSLRSGYFSSCGEVDTGMRITIYDSYEEDALQLDIWTDANMLPQRAEILYRGRRILTMEISNYTYV